MITWNKIWRKREIMLHGYWKFYNLQKNRRNLLRHCKRCWSKIWYLKLLIIQTITKTKNREVIGLIKDELGGEIMIRFAVLRLKTYSYLTVNNHQNKKTKRGKRAKKCVIKTLNWRLQAFSGPTELKNKINQTQKIYLM